jgi:hypothetical protein
LRFLWNQWFFKFELLYFKTKLQFVYKNVYIHPYIDPRKQTSIPRFKAQSRGRFLKQTSIPELERCGLSWVLQLSKPSLIYNAKELA